MTHEMALKLAKTETPEQMADRIVELYEMIKTERNAWRTTAARWGRAWQRAVEERNTLRAKLATARGRVNEVRYALSVMFDTAQGLSPEDWKQWAHGYIASMIFGLDEALAAVDAPQVREGEVGSITERERTCVWTPVRSSYETSCGHYLESYNGFGDSDIGDRGDYCRYCGGRIRIEERES